MPAAKTTPAAAARPLATPAQASLYQQLRGHLAALKMHDAEALPGVLDAATVAPSRSTRSTRTVLR